MAYDSVQITIASGAGIGASFTTSYPSGRTKADYDAADTDHALISQSGRVLFARQGDFSVTFGASTVTVSLSTSVAFAPGEVVWLRLDRGDDETDREDEVRARNQATRAALVTYIAENGIEAGAIYSDGTVQYVGSTGATDVSDLPGLVPFGTPSFAHWGFTASGSHNVNPAIDYVSSLGGGEILLTEIITVSAPVVLKSGVIIRGTGMFSCGFKAANSLNDHVVETVNFDSLTGTNTWLTSGGVPYGFGLYDMQIDGNKANNTAGRGWNVYGKGYFFDNLLIKNTAKEGWYSECAFAGGQTDETDLPEGNMGAIFIFQPGTRGTDASEGMIYKGPHDGRIATIVVASSDGDGAQFLTDGSTYNGKCDVDFMHVYGCYRKGIVWSAGGSATHLIGESCDEEGVQVAGNDAQIGMIEAYRNGIRSASTGREFNVYIEGAGHVINHIETRDSSNAEGGVSLTGNRCTINVSLDGQGTSSKTGLLDSGQSNIVTGRINGFNVAGGIGLDAGGQWSRYDLTIDDCATAIDVASAGIGIDATIRADLETGQALFAGTDPMSGSALNKETSNWDVTAQINTTYYYTRQRKKSSSSFDATQAAGTTGVITIGHNIPFAPDPEDITFGLQFDDGAGGTPAGQPQATVAINGAPTTSQVAFRWTITNSGSTSDRGFIIMNIRY